MRLGSDGSGKFWATARTKLFGQLKRHSRHSEFEQLPLTILDSKNAGRVSSKGSLEAVRPVTITALHDHHAEYISLQSRTRRNEGNVSGRNVLLMLLRTEGLHRPLLEQHSASNEIRLSMLVAEIEDRPCPIKVILDQLWWMHLAHAETQRALYPSFHTYIRTLVDSPALI